MAAGLGFKDFVTGEVLTAADVDGYLMQGVWVFASAAARDAAVTSPQEGNFAYLKDTNVTTYYTGSAWANLDTTGMTNPMTTTGDTIYSSSGSTPARVGIGTAGQVLQVNSGATAPEWATPAGGTSGLNLISTTSFSAVSSVSITSPFSATYDNYLIRLNNTTAASGAWIGLRLRVGGTDTSTNYRVQKLQGSGSSAVAARSTTETSMAEIWLLSTTFNSETYLTIANPFATKPTSAIATTSFNPNADVEFQNKAYGLNDSTSYTGFTLLCGANMTGSVSVYGYGK